jgi:plastocyanin
MSIEAEMRNTAFSPQIAQMKQIGGPPEIVKPRSALSMLLRSFPILLSLLTLAVIGSAFAQKCEKIYDVGITSEFDPRELAIRQGDCVRWTNVDKIEHSAGGLGREFNTGQLMPGGTALITFDKPGEIPYWCLHHPVMQAKLIVKPK